MHRGFDNFQFATEDYAFEPHMQADQHSLSITPPGDHSHSLLYDQYEAMYNSTDTVPVQDAWYSPMV